MSKPTTTSDPLVVVVSGGGPVGLTFSLHLTMMMGKHVKIIIYEGRWFVDQQGRTRWQGEQQGKTRRDQVVTLQDHVIKQMPDYISKGLFERYDERVWPTSRNIPIQEVEDRLFELIQPFVENGQIELIPENLNEQSQCLIQGDFDILVGADGSNSFVRRYCNIQMISEGIEYACGVAYDIPTKVCAAEEPLHQALNCIFTVSQTRYLVNSSTSRRGYLNIRLIKNEYDELRERLTLFQSRNEPIDLLDYDKCPQSPVWSIIRQGLEFFKIPSKYVFRVIPIEINVRHASIVVRELRFQIPKNDKSTEKKHKHQYKTMLAFLAGDAAMNVHFWPGRGMNSGMKGAIALARNILRSCSENNTILIRKPLRFLDFLDYEGFMARLRAREQQGRSLRVLVNPIDRSIEDSYSYAHLPHCYQRYTNKLIEKLKDTRQRLQERPEWPHKSKVISDEELQSALHRIAPQAVAQLSLANPWPTREMGGIEILVEDIFPYDKEKFLPVPIITHVHYERMPTIIVQRRLAILWIIGDKTINTIDHLIADIQSNYLKSSTNNHLRHQLTVVQTIEKATEWLQANRTSCERPDTIFKMITVWTIKDNQTAIDAIRAVRSEFPRVPVLIFTNRHEDTQQASEYLNVMVTGDDFELKEFAGIKQETQWGEGCRALHSQRTTLDDKKQPSPTDQIMPSMLLWIDLPGNDSKTRKSIEDAHPQLEMSFIPTFSVAETFLRENTREIHQKNLMVICRSYYIEEKKNFCDLASLLDELRLGIIPLAVYTKNRENVLKRNPNRPEQACIFDKSGDILAFINKHMNK